MEDQQPITNQECVIEPSVSISEEQISNKSADGTAGLDESTERDENIL